MGVVLKAMAKILVKDSHPIDVGCMRGEVEFSAKDSDSKGRSIQQNSVHALHGFS
jgi:hypothetical protein